MCWFKFLNQSIPQVDDNWAIATFLAGTTEAVLKPLKMTQVLLQMKQYHKHYRNMEYVFREFRANNCIREYYWGCSAILMQNGSSNILFFLGRETIWEKYLKTDNRYKNIAADFESRALLGAFISTVFFLINVVKTWMQSLGQISFIFMQFWQK